MWILFFSFHVGNEKRKLKMLLEPKDLETELRRTKNYIETNSGTLPQNPLQELEEWLLSGHTHLIKCIWSNKIKYNLYSSNTQGQYPN